MGTSAEYGDEGSEKRNGDILCLRFKPEKPDNFWKVQESKKWVQ